MAYEQENEVCFGVYRCCIVGLKYYSGTVSDKEMVSLRREPQNPHDRNAIGVYNVSGVQVGHIKREQARALADIVDRKLARIEGVVPYGQQNNSQMPCDISFWGKTDSKNEVFEIMKRYGYPLTSSEQPAPSVTKRASSSQQSIYGMGVASPPPIRISQGQEESSTGSHRERYSRQAILTTSKGNVVLGRLLSQANGYRYQKKASRTEVFGKNAASLPLNKAQTRSQELSKKKSKRRHNKSSSTPSIMTWIKNSGNVTESASQSTSSHCADGTSMSQMGDNDVDGDTVTPVINHEVSGTVEEKKNTSNS